ncbi:hypothetical protein E2562_019206 [Oryza meyeriana var. granulata]|uniref:Reverse transcriptase Ty1/copia-type domain-containing protein n=1 Tax=Oryza meyeriana var. granulata TaxID=110450 RepID=A0A6G1F9X4_9ORYZ|nr:hypothetical protein E2562_019206 [Oryza meyeriana var. granulata]
METGADFVVEYRAMELGDGRFDADTSAGSPEPPATPTPAATPSPAPAPLPQPEYWDADNDDVELRYRTIDNVLGAASPPGLVTRQVAAELHLQIEEEPATFAEAENHQSWRRAMIEELDSIESNRTWRLVPLPPGHCPIGLKWVYKVKKNAAGEVIKHKARLVAKGYVQQSGVDFDEVFAPVARIESVRLLLALAAQEGWPVHHMDVKFAFLNGELVEEVYVRQPPGFTVVGHEDKVLRLDKALYGLRQALRAWNAKLDETLVAGNAVRSSDGDAMERLDMSR